jgi:hypothetical protein
LAAVLTLALMVDETRGEEAKRGEVES